MGECCGNESGMAFKKVVLHDSDECCGGFARRFQSKEEKVSGLKEYLKDLEAETIAVKEAIADLK